MWSACFEPAIVFEIYDLIIVLINITKKIFASFEDEKTIDLEMSMVIP